LITPTALSDGSSECVYVVRSGDNLFRIAVNNNTTVDAMRAANPSLVGEAPILQPGQELRLPDCQAQATAVPPPGSNVTDIPAPPAGTTIYTVQAGDTLFSIAQRFGITVQAIINANSLANPDALAIGQQLNIPQAGS
jgi:LysM repeat protein